MLSKKELRDTHIAVAVAAVILFGGGFLVRDAGEAATLLVVLAAFSALAGILVFSTEKEVQDEERDQ